MVHRYKIDGKTVSRKTVVEKIGEARLKNLEREADVQFRADPLVQNDFFVGPFLISIEFPIMDN